MPIWPWIIRQARKEYSPDARLAAIGFEGLTAVVAVPTFLYRLSIVGGDRWRVELHPVISGSFLVLAVLGLLLALWTVWVQYRHARGTPVPIMATKKLLTDGPYSVCRNPMALGTIVYYFGVSAFTSSLAPVLATVVLSASLILLIRCAEEKELLERFGEEYREYRRHVPFIIPRFGSCRHSGQEGQK